MRISLKQLDRLIRDRRIGAPAVTVVILSVTIAAAVAAQMDLDARRSERDLKAELADRLAASSATRGKSDEADFARLGTPFLRAETATTAAAELDRMLRATVAKAQGAVVSTQATIEAGGDPTARRIDIRAAIEGRNAAIQRALLQLETGAPAIFIEELTLQPKETAQGKNERNPDPLLQVSLTLNAAWRSGI
jgi:hypothetical protein